MSLATPAKAAVPSKSRTLTDWADDPEVQLMLRVQEGDQEAFAELQHRYMPRVLGYFYRQVRDRSEAEDLTQDVFLRLYRSRKSYKPRARFGTWLFHITQNVARNAVRSKRRKPCIHMGQQLQEHREVLEAKLAERVDPCECPLERAELAKVVRAAVAELAGRQRAAVELHQFQERTYAQVAAELDMTPKAAKSLLYRARLQLRNALQGWVG
jgi:RNA polymerase sigma-70 factor (ECF subfamily)